MTTASNYDEDKHHSTHLLFSGFSRFNRDTVACIWMKLTVTTASNYDEDKHHSTHLLFSGFSRFNGEVNITQRSLYQRGGIRSSSVRVDTHVRHDCSNVTKWWLKSRCTLLLWYLQLTFRQDLHTQTDIQTHRVTDIQTHRVTDIQTHRVTDIQTQSNRHTNTE